jgi:dipeptide/tripeptide permease
MSKRNSDWYIPPDLLALLGLFFVLPCIAVLASILLPLVARLQTSNIRALYGFGLGSGVLGAILLLVARLPLYKQRRFWTVGPTQLDRKHCRLYWLAYIFIASSLLLLAVVWLRV